jgi:hypothetical protein
MEEIFAQVEEFCPKELNAFMLCVEENPTTWPKNCAKLQANL